MLIVYAMTHSSKVKFTEYLFEKMFQTEISLNSLQIIDNQIGICKRFGIDYTHFQIDVNVISILNWRDGHEKKTFLSL